MRVFVDTNIWVYTLDRADPKRRERAIKALANMADAQLGLSVQVLNEFYNVVTRRLKQPLTREQAIESIAALQRFTVIPIDSALVSSAFEIGAEASLSHWDSLIVAAAERAGCEVLWTEDLNPGQKIRGVSIINPLV